INPQQDVMATLILTISLHFIGDFSHLKDRNTELLSNLKCRKLIMLREDSNQSFRKEKFLAELPDLLGENVRNKIRETSEKQVIQYNEFNFFGEDTGFSCRHELRHTHKVKIAFWDFTMLSLIIHGK
ncbi:hypothetical protein MIMGU_mgv1a023114mg, partial [Erythranthe guttata]